MNRTLDTSEIDGLPERLRKCAGDVLYDTSCALHKAAAAIEILTRERNTAASFLVAISHEDERCFGDWFVRDAHPMIDVTYHASREEAIAEVLRRARVASE